jgi:hypothetical protein
MGGEQVDHDETADEVAEQVIEDTQDDDRVDHLVAPGRYVRDGAGTRAGGTRVRTSCRGHGRDVRRRIRFSLMISTGGAIDDGRRARPGDAGGRVRERGGQRAC